MAGIAYHPWFAAHGTKDFSDGKKWYETSIKVTSLYDCVVNAGTGNGRPDSKTAEHCCINGQGGLICYAIPNAKTPTYKHQEEVRRNLVDGYIENRSNVITQGFMTVYEELTATAKTLWNLTYKAIEVYQVLYTADSGVTWDTQTFTHDSVNNQITLGTARAEILVSYKAQNQPAVPVSTPKPIEVVDRDLIASNHHSVYAYNGLTYASSGKIATGNSVETKGIEDVVLNVYDYKLEVGVSVTIQDGKTYLIGNGFNNLTAGSIYILKNSGHSTPTMMTPDATWTNNFYLLGSITTTPKHQPLTLDNQSIVASKALIAQASNATQVFIQELDYDSTAGDLGDNNKFDQLTSGTLTDLNGHTVQTKVLLKPSSIYLGE